MIVSLWHCCRSNQTRFQKEVDGGGVLMVLGEIEIELGPRWRLDSQTQHGPLTLFGFNPCLIPLLRLDIKDGLKSWKSGSFSLILPSFLSRFSQAPLAGGVAVIPI